VQQGTPEPDFEHAKQYALRRLERELPPKLIYHSLSHTRDEVASAVEYLAAQEHVNGSAVVLVRTAALYHDIGFVESTVMGAYGHNHEAIGARIAAQVLPRFGYSPAQIQRIIGMIMATKIPQSPRDVLEQIVADADLDLLGREDFWIRNQNLRDEIAAFGVSTDDDVWYQGQLQFLRAHRYFTQAARALRGPRKQRHIEQLLGMTTKKQAERMLIPSLSVAASST